MKNILVISLITALSSFSFAQGLSDEELRDLRQAHKAFRISQAQDLSFQDEMKALKKDTQSRSRANRLDLIRDHHGFTVQEVKDLRQAYRDFRRSQTQVLSFEDEMKSLKKDQQARANENQLGVFAND